MKKNRERRKLKNYLFVNKAQVTILVSNLILVALVVGITAFAVLGAVYSDIFKTDDVHMQHLSANLFLVLSKRCIVAFFILFVPVVIQQVFVIHKICGPFVNFKRAVDRFSMGDFSQKIFLRRYDFFKKEAHQINGILENLGGVIDSLSRHQNTIILEIEALAKNPEKSDQITTALKGMETCARASIDELAKIKVVDASRS